MDTIGSRVREARKKAGLNQTELGDLVGGSQQIITKIESGEVKNTSYLDGIAKALNVSYTWLKDGVADTSSINSADNVEEFVSTAMDALRNALTSAKAISIQQGKDPEHLDNTMLFQAFEIHLRGKLTGDYAMAALGSKGLKKA